MPVRAKLADTPTLRRLNAAAASKSMTSLNEEDAAALDPEGRHVGVAVLESDDGTVLWTAWLITITGCDDPGIGHIQIPIAAFETLADSTLRDDVGQRLEEEAQKQYHLLLRAAVIQLMRTRRPS